MEPVLLSIGREALLLVLLLSGPPLLAALVAGLVVGVLQAATQIQEPAIAVAPRVVAAVAALGVAAPWISARLARFALTCLELAGEVAR